MADLEFDAYGAPEEAHYAQSGLASRALSWVGAVSSVGLVLGLAIWGVQLTMRDVSEVPVIRALEGPARVQPDNPGGQLAQHQGLAVNTVQAEGEAEGPTPQVVLAPEPIDLTEEDVALTTPAVADPATDTVAEAIGTVVALSTAQRSLPPEEQAEILAAQLAARVEPLEPLAEEEVPVTLARAEIPAIDPSVPGVVRSSRPAQRPQVNLASLQQEAAVAAATGAVVRNVIDVDASTIVAGTRLVQLGAFDTQDIAKAEWDKIAARFEDYLVGKKRVIQEAKSGGRSFYRLRAVGFDDLNASRRFCAVLVAENAACIPVLAR